MYGRGFLAHTHNAINASNAMNAKDTEIVASLIEDCKVQNAPSPHPFFTTKDTKKNNVLLSPHPLFYNNGDAEDTEKIMCWSVSLLVSWWVEGKIYLARL